MFLKIGWMKLKFDSVLNCCKNTHVFVKFDVVFHEQYILSIGH